MRAYVWVVITGIIVRATVIALQPGPLHLHELEPSVIARNLNEGRGFTFEQYGAMYRAWKEPLSIVLLAQLTRWTGEQPWLIVLVQSAFGIGAALGVALIARRLFGPSGRAILAGIIAAANPFLVYYDTHCIHPLSLDALLFVAVVATLLSVVPIRGKGMSGVAASGFLMGVALWQRASLLASGVASWLAGLACAGRRDRGVVARRFVVWVSLAVLVIAPWVIRNYRLFGRVVLTTDAAHIFWLGNNPWSNGTYSDMAGQRVIAHADPAFLAKLRGASEVEQSDLFWAEAARFIREHPGRFAGLVVRRLWAFVWFSPNAGIEYAAWQGLLYRVAYIGLLTLGLLGFVGFWQRAGPEGRCRALLLGAAVAGLAAVHAVTAINLKHRVPLELVLSLFAAEALARGLARTRGALNAVRMREQKGEP